MSTAAPATGPAPVAPAAPTAAPVAPGVTGQPEAVPVVPSPKTIKPIPPPRLPGVLEDGPEDASAPEAQAARARDAAGRFAKTSTGEPIVGKPQPTAVDAADGEPVIPEPPGEAKPFVFAGKPFKSQAEAEHWAKSMEGRYEPIQKAATKHEAELVKAAYSAREWQKVAETAQARLAELENGATPAPNGATTPDSGGIDWGLYAEIARVANEAGTPEKAQQWLVEQIEAQRKADIAALREEAIETPRREAEEQAQLQQTAGNLVNSMAAQTEPDGSPSFPEMRDGAQARAVGELWRSLGLDPMVALTDAGAIAAVALYRMARGINVVPAPAPAPATPAPPPSNPAADAAAGLDGGRPLMPAAMSRRELDPSVARLVAGLKSKELIRPGLGFEA